MQNTPAATMAAMAVLPQDKKLPHIPHRTKPVTPPAALSYICRVKQYMKRFFGGLVFLCLCAVSCDTSRVAEQQIESENLNPAGHVKYSTETYIEHYKDVAIWQMRKYGVPASIILAQAILESNSGNSELASVARNHFGIKCNKDWNGRTYLKDDEHKNECFRMYADEAESFRDHIEFLKKDRYANLFDLDKTDYRGWARGLKKDGYATNPKYHDLLISLIERYKLYEYDRKRPSRRGNYLGMN